MVMWRVPRSRGVVLFLDTVTGASQLDAALVQSATSLAPFTSGSGTTICVHVSADFTKAVFVWPASGDQLYEITGGSTTNILGVGGLSLDGDVPGQIAIGTGAYVWTAHQSSNINRYTYPDLNFDASIGIVNTCYGLAADASDNIYFWDFTGGNGRLHRQNLAGTDTIILTEADVGERHGLGFNPFDGLLYEYRDEGSGTGAKLRKIDPSTGTPTDLVSLNGGGGSLQPCFTPDGAVWLMKRISAGSRDVYRWDIAGAALTTSTADPDSGTALVPLL